MTNNKNDFRIDTRYRFFDIGNMNFEARDKDDNVIKDSNDDYFVYMTGVNFKQGNVIEGRYKGTLTNDSPILDNHCKTVTTDGNKYIADGQQIKTARMVAINNKTGVVVII